IGIIISFIQARYRILFWTSVIQSYIFKVNLEIDDRDFAPGCQPDPTAKNGQQRGDVINKTIIISNPGSFQNLVLARVIFVRASAKLCWWWDIAGWKYLENQSTP
ncbi:MAG TPA: hypothetical protein VLH15_04350, partial [Dehalococcoidales bacterium]|nr:hypothetical protein [Dehalococcoidales bacterium]